MEINLDINRMPEGVVKDLINYLLSDKLNPLLSDSQCYFEFPILKDNDDAVIIAQLMIISQNYGVIIINISDLTTRHGNISKVLQENDSFLDNVVSLLFSRLIRTKSLRVEPMKLAFPILSILFTPLLETIPEGEEFNSTIIQSNNQLYELLNEKFSPVLTSTSYQELISTVEGTKGMVRVKDREIGDGEDKLKAVLANRIESELTRFDLKQKQGAMVVLDGFQRIRGLAGSGKTIVLAMKAALTHLRNPNAKIVYTFYTKSLYQHVKRLITRFYRQFDDKDPDWSKLKIIHGWGGFRTEGVYFNACIANDVIPYTFGDLMNKTSDPFDYACKELLRETKIFPSYDYIFVDEGQDFPASFIQLCLMLASSNKLVFAYDDLQTIFQARTPSIEEIVGKDANGSPLVSLNEDIVLDICYRNPREILICAHALGFGIYGKQIVQMLENKEQWQDIGYVVHKGEFIAGSETIIERPLKNSLPVISTNQTINDIVKANSFDSFNSEISNIITSIQQDISEGLRPDDILVICVDDRYAKNYLLKITVELESVGIGTNNIHNDNYNVQDFYREGCVTLSTVHKAKGNEAFMVYVVGVDALYRTYAGVRERNVLFTAMTRAKGWVRVSGIGDGAAECKTEIDLAIKNSPNLFFTYPSEEQLKIIKRDLAEKASRKHKAEKKLEEVLNEISPEDIKRYLEQKDIKKE